MDILNWLYSKISVKVKDTLNSPKDLIALGANVGYEKRGDQYQTYCMTAEDFLASACKDTNTYTSAGDPGWVIQPSMVSTCTTINANFLIIGDVTFDSYKIAGTAPLLEVASSGVIPIGSITWTNPTYFGATSFKITGSVDINDSGSGNWVSTPFGSNALFSDDVTFALEPVDLRIEIDYSTPGAADLFLVWNAVNTTNDINAYVTFEYEFIIDAASGTVTFTS